MRVPRERAPPTTSCGEASYSKCARWMPAPPRGRSACGATVSVDKPLRKNIAHKLLHRTDCTTYRCEKNPNTREQNRNLSGGSSESWSLDLFPGFAISSRFSRVCCEDSTRPDLAAHLFIVQGGLLLYDSYTVSDVANVMFVRACFVRSRSACLLSFGTTLDFVPT